MVKMTKMRFKDKQKVRTSLLELKYLFIFYDKHKLKNA